MQFTPQELKLVERLRKAERLWPRLRWGILAAAIISTVALALCGYLLFKVLLDVKEWGENREDGVVAIAVAYLFPKCLMWAAITTWLFAKLITQWHGNVNRMLLLKLLDARLAESTKCDSPPGTLK